MRDTGLKSSMYQIYIQTNLHDNESVVIKLFRLQNILKYKVVTLKTCHVSYGFLPVFKFLVKSCYCYH